MNFANGPHIYMGIRKNEESEVRLQVTLPEIHSCMLQE
jgi:hypothetical protein